MEISVTGRHVDITEPMDKFVRDKVLRLERLYDRVDRANIVVCRESTRFRTELVLHADHKHTFVAQTEADEFNASVDLVIDKMERQLHEHKEKLRNRKHQPGDATSTGM